MAAGPNRETLHLLGLATWMELESAAGSVVSHVLRDDGAAVEAARLKAHDLLDQHLDAKIASVTAIRLDVAKQFQGK